MTSVPRPRGKRNKEKDWSKGCPLQMTARLAQVLAPGSLCELPKSQVGILAPV